MPPLQPDDFNVISVSLTASAGPAAGPLADIQAGHWFEAPNTNVRAAEKQPKDWPDWDGNSSASYDSYQRNTGITGLIAAWNSGTYDTSSDRFILFGGGHNDYGGNEIFGLDIATLVWVRIIDPTAFPKRKEDGGTWWVNTDNTPISRHTYGGIVYLDHVNRLFVKGGAPDASAGGCSTPGTWTFDLASNTWQLMDPTGDFSNEGCEAKCIYDPVSDNVYFLSNGDDLLHEYVYATNVFTTLNLTAFAPAGKSLAVDTNRHDLWVLGNNGADARVYDLDASPPEPVATVTTGSTALLSDENPGLVYDPVSDKLVGWYGGTTLYALDLGTLVWDSVSPNVGNPATPPTVSAAGGVFGRFQYIPSQDLFVLVNSVDQNVFFFKPDRTSGPLAMPVGALTHDGPTTPEQLSLYMAVTGTLPQSATATVRYKETSAGTWSAGHPLHRIQPGSSNTPAVGSVPDAFAWPIIGLAQGTSYDVEVTVTSGAAQAVKTASFTTRTLPPASGAATVTVAAGSTTAQIESAFAGLVPGDVLEFENGTYNVDDLGMNVTGTLASPIYIRGQSRDGVILSDPTDVILNIESTSHVVIEDLTLQGSGSDSGTSASSRGINFSDLFGTQERVTIRNVVMNGVDKGIIARLELSECLVYDCTLNGNNEWLASFLDTNITWNDDGIRIPGFGNVAFNNTLVGFGDTLSFGSHVSGDTLTETIGCHFYRNDVRVSCDDFIEADHAHRNVSCYDNRCHNAMTFLSLDPLYGGPLLATRNITINIGRQPFKWNDQNSGQFVYNNTMVKTTGFHWLNAEQTAEAGWYQANNGAQNYYGYRNNLLVYRGVGGQTIRLDNTGHDFLDFTHNSWYADEVFQWQEGTFTSLADALANLPATTPVFSGSTQRHENDNITVSNPWTVTVTLGDDYYTEVTATYTPTLSAGETPKNSGVVIANVTDGFSGAAPDRGAIIDGRAVPSYGAP